MERTSIITVLLLADAADYASLTLVNGLPDTDSLVDYFHTADLVLERNRLNEATSDSPQGQLVEYSLQVAVHRDSDYHRTFTHKKVLAYIETSNGEQYFLGSPDYPLSYTYQRSSGQSVSDTRETQLNLSVTLPV